MQMCKASDVPIMKGDKLSNEQCPNNDLEKDAMKTIPYASVIVSLMYVRDLILRLLLMFLVDIYRTLGMIIGLLQRKS